MQRAGKLQSGELQVETAVKSQTAKFVIVACDASQNTHKLFKDKCSYYKVPFAEFGTKERLGASIGRNERSSLAIIDEGFAKSFQEKLTTLKQNQEEPD